MQNKKLKELLKVCIKEQEKIGMYHYNEIKISFNNTAKTKAKCSNDAIARAYTDSDGKRNIILNEKYFNKLSYLKQKELIHHELIHCLKTKSGEYIKHILNWKEFKMYSDAIEKEYGYKPLSSYDVNCLKGNNKIRYNFYTKCPRCGQTNYFYLENKNTINEKKCHNCGEIMNSFPIKYKLLWQKIKKLAHNC